MVETPVRRSYLVYLYAVCLVSVLILLYAGAAGLFGGVRILVPEQTVAEQGSVTGPGNRPIEQPPDAVEQERRRGVGELIQNAIFCVLAGLLFVLHWRRAARLRRELQRTPPVAGGPS